MKIKQVTCYYEMKMPSKVQFGNYTLGGSITIDVEPGEDARKAFKFAWLATLTQVLQQMNARISNPDTRDEEDKSKSELKKFIEEHEINYSLDKEDKKE